MYIGTKLLDYKNWKLRYSCAKMNHTNNKITIHLESKAD